jgi:hypothetical protein
MKFTYKKERRSLILSRKGQQGRPPAARNDVGAIKRKQFERAISDASLLTASAMSCPLRRTTLRQVSARAAVATYSSHRLLPFAEDAISLLLSPEARMRGKSHRSQSSEIGVVPIFLYRDILNLTSDSYRPYGG